MSDASHADTPGQPEETRRDFLTMAAIATGAIGTASFAWPLIDQMNPSADVLALASTELDISKIAPGQSVTIKWRGAPVFVRHRTPEEVAQAKNVQAEDLKDPQPDGDRVEKDAWLVLVGVCTHLGCVPLGQKPGHPQGDFGGWFCPCHGSHYDTSGRIRKGPAPRNLPVPPYRFLDDNTIRIG